MKLIGRDTELSEIVTSIEKGRSFVLRGELGMGKTAIMEWAFQNCGGLFWAGKRGHLENMKGIAEIRGFEGKTNEIEQQIREISGAVIFVDDVHKLTPKAIALMTELQHSNTICVSIRAGIKVKDEIKPMLNGFDIEIAGLKRSDAMRFVKESYYEIHKSEPSQHFVSKCVSYSLGNPRNMQVSIRNRKVNETAKPSTSEIDLSPALLIIGAFFVIFRVIGKADEFSSDYALIGSFSIFALFMFRMFQKASSTKSEKG